MDPWRWQVRKSEVVLDRPWLRLKLEHLVLPTGAEIDEFYLIESGDWVGVLAREQAGRIVLAEQYRRGLDAVSCELPAGMIEVAESPLAAAQRELREETGYAAEHWELLITLSTEPVRHTTRAHFFFASGARPEGEPRPDRTEQIRLRLAEPAELLADVESGKIAHGVHVGAILLAARRGLL